MIVSVASRNTRNWMMISLICFTLLVPQVAHALNPQPEPPLPEISVLIDGKPLMMDVLPVIKDGRTLVPLRAIFEALSASVVWNPLDQSIVATKGNTTVWLQIGNATARISYELPRWLPDFSTTAGTMAETMSITLDVPPQIVNGRTLVPVRFVSEALDSKVGWQGVTRTVTVDVAARIGALVPDITGEYLGLATCWKPESKYPTDEKRLGTVLVLVNQDLYPLIKPSLETYTADLLAEGYATDLYTVKGGGAVELKQFIRKWHSGLLAAHLAGQLSIGCVLDGSGVVMVGDLPIPWIYTRMGSDEDNGGLPWEGLWICDLYLTDMDGNWDTVNRDGHPFLSTVDPDVIAADSECVPNDTTPAYLWTSDETLGKSGARPEIWLGHITPSPICATVNGKTRVEEQAVYIRDYFARNHAYRHRQFPYVTSGVDPESVAARNRLLYWDEPWVDKAETYAESLQYSFAGPLLADWAPATGGDYTRYVASESETTKADYTALLVDCPYIWVESLMHSAPTVHEFSHTEYGGLMKPENVVEDYLYPWEVEKGNYRGLFYHLQGCSACRYSEAANLGTTYLFADDGLAVIGNTTVGAHDQRTLHYMLSRGLNVGQALMMSQRLHLLPGWLSSEEQKPGTAQPKRYYQQVLLGDPTLRPEVFTPHAAPVAATRQPDLDRIRVDLPLAANGPADVRGAVATEVGRLVSEAPPALRRLTAIIPLGSRLLPADPAVVVRDPFTETESAEEPAQPPVAPVYRLTLAPVAQSITPGMAVNFAGTLVSSSGSLEFIPVSGKMVHLYALVTPPSGGSAVRSMVGRGITGADGRFLIAYYPSTSSTYLAVYAAADGTELAVSERSVITVVTRR